MDAPAAPPEMLVELVHRAAEMCRRSLQDVTVSASFNSSGELRFVLTVSLSRGRARGEGPTTAAVLLDLEACLERKTRTKRKEGPELAVLRELASVPTSLRDAFVQATMGGEVTRLRELRGEALDAYAKVKSREWHVSELAIAELAAWLRPHPV